MENCLVVSLCRRRDIVTIKTYRFLGDSRKVDKTLHDVSTYSNAVIVGDMSIHNPTISLQLDSFTDVINFNYIYIPELRRYYYVVDSTIREDGFVQLQCKVDVLKSFKNDILGSTQYIDRQQNKCTYQLPDGMYNIKSNRNLTIKNFGNVIIEPNANFLLQTSGKVV